MIVKNGQTCCARPGKKRLATAASWPELAGSDERDIAAGIPYRQRAEIEFARSERKLRRTAARLLLRDCRAEGAVFWVEADGWVVWPERIEADHGLALDKLAVEVFDLLREEGGEDGN